MATQTWQPQSAQPPVPGQTQIAGPPGHWAPTVSAPIQDQQGIPQSSTAVSSSIPPSPSTAGTLYRGPEPSNSEPAGPLLPPSITTPSAAGVLQAGSYSTPTTPIGQAAPGYAPLSNSYPAPRWQPAPVAHTQTGPSGSPGPGGPPGLPVLSGPPGLSVPSLPSGLPGASTAPGPPGFSAPQGPTGPSAPPVPSGPPGPPGLTTTMPVGPPGLTVPPVPPGLPGLTPPVPPGAPGMGLPSMPPVLAIPPVTPVSAVQSGPPGTPGPPGLAVNPPGLSVSVGTPGLSVIPGPSITPGTSITAGLPGPSGQSGPSGLPAPPAITPIAPPGLSGPAGLLGTTAVGSVPPASPGIPGVTASPSSSGLQAPVDATPLAPKSPISTTSNTGPTVTAGSGTVSIAPVIPPLQYAPYANIPSVTPQISPWTHQSQTGGGQLQQLSFPSYTTLPHPYTAQIRPVVPPQAGISASIKASPSSSAPLAPPGEQARTQVTASKASNNWGAQLLPTSSVSSSQVVNGPASSSGSGGAVNMMMQSKLHASVVTGMDKTATQTGLKAEIPGKELTADAWTAHKTPEGAVYYYNSLTEQSTYEKPPGFLGEADKVTAVPTPVSWEMITGTEWAQVTTNDAKKYYYNTITQVTSWQVPGEVAEHRKKQIEEASNKLSVGTGQTVATLGEKGTISFSLNIPGTVTWGREAHKALGPAASSSALDLIKKKLQDSATPGMGSPVGNSPGSISFDGAGPLDSSSNKIPSMEVNREKVKESTVEGSSSESSSDSDDEDHGPTKDERVLQFKEMLKEKGVVPFSKWEKELPKIIFDPRFKAIPSHTERRSIFDRYVRTRAEEERKEKRAAQKAAIEGFKQLLEEASKDINHNTDYESVARVWASDPRFDALERKDREALLNERVLPLRKMEEERVRAIHSAAVAGFKAMLKEKGEITTSSRWSRIKDTLRNDPRYRTVKREDREALFHSFLADLRAAEQEAERAAKAKREEEEKLKDRERELRKRKEREEQEMERVRAKARRKDAVTAYQALLTEKIKNPEASWTDCKPKLEKDTLGRATNPELDSADRERLFREHVNVLYERCVREYRGLLADVITIDAGSKQNEEGKNALNSWSEAKKLLKSDSRYSKMPRRDRESWWRRYAENMQRRLKAVSSASAKDDKRSANESIKGSALESSRHSPVLKRNSSQR